MSIYKQLRQRAQIGGIATRVLTIPVMAAALGAAYLTLRSQSAVEPAVLADGSAHSIAAPDEASLPPLMQRTGSTWPAPIVADPSLESHEALDPSGAGRMAP